MTTLNKKSVQVKLFIGACLTHELRIALNNSALWKQAQIERDFEEIPFNGKEYLGHFLQEAIQIDELKKLEERILQAIGRFCPSFDSNKVEIKVFSQIFVGSE